MVGLFLPAQQGGNHSAVHLHVGGLRQRSLALGMAIQFSRVRTINIPPQGRHEVRCRKPFLTFAAVDIGQRCADLAIAKIRAHIGQALQPGKGHPLGQLLTAQLLKELVWVSVAEGKAEAEVETALWTPLEFFVS